MTKDELFEELLKTANEVQHGIVMEIDTCDKHDNGKLPILDMEVWLSSTGDLLYQHYEKPVASKLVISERSAHSANCKRSVHVSEIIRRLCNTSQKLDWNEYVVPVISD